jgi:antitoxin component YwqK of YwqJK toxin-antitoxin module
MYVVYQSQVDRTRTLFKSYWYNGRPQTITFFHNAKKNGPSKLYLDNGVLIFEGFFFENEEDGSFTYYYPNGVIKKAEEYIRGKKIKTCYYNSEGVLNRTELNK